MIIINITIINIAIIIIQVGLKPVFPRSSLRVWWAPGGTQGGDGGGDNYSYDDW